MNIKIAVLEALPLQEFAQNPYAVLCTTSLGGHLSWFENGGGRWFAKPVLEYSCHYKNIADVDASRWPNFLIEWLVLSIL